MSSRSGPCARRLVPPVLALVLLLSLPLPVSAQNPVDPDFSFVEFLCPEFQLLTAPLGNGDPLGDLGIVVHCYDDTGTPLPGIPGSAFEIVNWTGTMVEWAPQNLSPLTTDDEGRIFLTEPFAASATLVHGIIAVVVDYGGEIVVLDDGGSGFPVEFRTPDLNHDGDVGFFDVPLMAAAFDCCEDTEECLRADFNGDGCVTLADQVIFAEYLHGLKRGARAAKAAADVDTTLFAGCIQRDFDDDGLATTLRDTVILMAGQTTSFKLLARDFVCLSGVEFEMTLPPGLQILGSPLAVSPFTDLQQHPPTVGDVRLTMTAPYVTSGPVFMCEFLLQATTPGIYLTEDFTFDGAVFADCHEPPREITACIGTPTPCEMSYLTQQFDQFISCPGNDLTLPDTVTVVMRDQGGNGVPGLPAAGFRVSLSDTAGSGRANTYALTALADTTDPNGELDFLFYPRGTCRWPDACLGLDIDIRYEGCDLKIHKTVQTLNLVRWDPLDGLDDLIDDEDIAVWEGHKLTRNWCLDLVRAYRCPVVTQASLDIVQGHYLDGCDVSDVPDPAGAASAWLRQNVPNPFNPTTEIRIALPVATERAEVTIHDLKGRIVRRLWDGPLPSTTQIMMWDGRDAGGRAVGSGVYLARLRALGRTETVRMALLR